MDLIRSVAVDLLFLENKLGVRLDNVFYCSDRSPFVLEVLFTGSRCPEDDPHQEGGLNMQRLDLSYLIVQPWQ